MDKYTIAPPSGSTNNSVGAEDRPWHEGHFDSVKLKGGDLGEYLAESTGYGIVSGCEPTISGLTVTVGAGIVHLADGTRKELSATNITLDNADGTNPRIDLVYIDSTGAVAKITGTAAASPSAPALPSNGISVAQVSVAANASTGTVADARKYADIDFYSYAKMCASDTDAFVALVEAGRTIRNAKFTLSRDVTFSLYNCQIIDSEIDINGHKLVFDCPAPSMDVITANTGNTVTIADTNGYAVGDFVKITSTTYNWLCYRTYISSIAGNVITLAETIPIAGVFGVIEKIKPSSITMSNCKIRNSGASNSLTFLPHINGACVENCDFDSSVYIIVNGAHVEINSCKDMSQISLYSATNCEVKSNVMHRSNGIRCVAIANCIIENNEIVDGYSKQYSQGIEIFGTNNSEGFVVNDTTYVSGVYNKIINNTVINANTGVAGSAIGGIHLNNGARKNIIDGNICNYNGIGIYLENNCKFNVISNNICNYNGDYYGVGIELDWDCDGNIIKGNECNYNAGSTTANESCGIEIRGGAGVGHACYHNIIDNNVCVGNSRCGIINNGISTTIGNNKMIDNGTGTGYSSVGQLIVDSVTVCKISKNSMTGVNPLVGYSTYSICSGVCIDGNDIQGATSEPSILFNGISRSTIVNNFMSQGITIETATGNASVTAINNFCYNYDGVITIKGVAGYKCAYNYKPDGALPVVATDSSEY